MSALVIAFGLGLATWDPKPGLLIALLGFSLWVLYETLDWFFRWDDERLMRGQFTQNPANRGRCFYCWHEQIRRQAGYSRMTSHHCIESGRWVE